MMSSKQSSGAKDFGVTTSNLGLRKRRSASAKSWLAIGSLLICVAVGFDSTYYPLFAAFFLLCAGLVTYFMKGSACTLRTWPRRS